MKLWYILDYTYERVSLIVTIRSLFYEKIINLNRENNIFTKNRKKLYTINDFFQSFHRKLPWVVKILKEDKSFSEAKK